MANPSSSDQQAIRPILAFQILNSTDSTTTKKPPLLLLHGGFSSHVDFTYVTPLLASYTLLIPDLPSHGLSTSSSRAIRFDPRDTCALLADLITTNSPSGTVHVVGVSLGGVVGLLLAATYPDLVESVFVTGCGRQTPKSAVGRWVEATILGAILPAIIIVLAWLPASWHHAFYTSMGVRAPPGLQETQRSAAGFGIGWTLAQSLFNGEIGPGLIEKVRAKVLVCCAALDDDAKGTVELGERLKKGNEESRAVLASGMRHVWCCQDEDLFARAVVGWVERSEVVEGLELL